MLLRGVIDVGRNHYFTGGFIGIQQTHISVFDGSPVSKTESSLFERQMTGSICRVDFLENRTVGFDENSAAGR